MADESSDARLARIDERTKGMQGSMERLMATLDAHQKAQAEALREHETRLHTHLTSEILALRDDKDKAHAELTAGQERLSKRVSIIEEKVDGFESLIDRAKGASAAAKLLYGLAGATGAGALGALAQVVFGG